MPEQSPATTPQASPTTSKRRHNLQRLMSSPTRQHQGSSNERIDDINTILDSATGSSANQWQLLTEKDPKNKLTPLRSAISSNNASNVTEYLASAYKHMPTLEKYQELLTSGTGSLTPLLHIIQTKNLEMLKTFLQHTQSHLTEEQSAAMLTQTFMTSTPYCAAIQTKTPEILRCYVEHVATLIESGHISQDRFKDIVTKGSTFGKTPSDLIDDIESMETKAAFKNIHQEQCDRAEAKPDNAPAQTTNIHIAKTQGTHKDPLPTVTSTISESNPTKTETDATTTPSLINRGTTYSVFPAGNLSKQAPYEPNAFSLFSNPVRSGLIAAAVGVAVAGIAYAYSESPN